VLALHSPGALDLGYARLEPGDWGRFHGLPTRRDVAEALAGLGIQVIRFGGSAVNVPDYRWKHMIGLRDRRPPYRGNWYPQSSNGWGIIDFLAFCRAANLTGIPALHMGESPQDVVDFLEYVNGDPTTPWGRRRVEDGYGAPFNLRYLELGNEERVDPAYAERFEALAEAAWKVDPNLTVIVGDFVYEHPIDDPDHLQGAASRITNMDGHRRILGLAARHQREVWFDVHVWTDSPRRHSSVLTFPTYVAALERLAAEAGARARALIFELNANSHDQARALSNVQAILDVERLGNVPIVCSANALQPDGQNDNGWNQGLLFLDPLRVWRQPPAHALAMMAPLLPGASRLPISGLPDGVDGVALRRGPFITLQLLNASPNPQPLTLRLDGFLPTQPDASCTTLAAPLDARNTPTDPNRVAPVSSSWTHGLTPQRPDSTPLVLPPHAFTVIELK
jgi:hypothetical protein